jgi:hypothetical protein
MVPAQKRFGPRDLARDEAHLRLVSERELDAFHRVSQRLLGIDLLLVLGGEIGVEQAVLTAAARLGVVHSDVRSAHQRLDAGSVLGRRRDPDRGADIDAVRAELERLGNGERNPPRDALDLGYLIDDRK